MKAIAKMSKRVGSRALFGTLRDGLTRLSRLPAGRIAVLAVLAAPVPFLLVGSTHSASASCSSPIAELGLKAGSLGATRAGLELGSPTGKEPEALSWRIEYSAREAGPWQTAGSGTGETGSKQYVSIRHLTPETRYYVRASVEDECGHDLGTFQFTTEPVSAPEITTVDIVEHEHEQWIGATFAHFSAEIETNAAETHYRFEYAAKESGPWTVAAGCSGTITVTEEFSEPECALTGLSPETEYYLRVVAENEKGHDSEEYPHKRFATGKGFETITAKPRVNGCAYAGKITTQCISPDSTSIAATSVTLHESIRPDGSETHWRYEYATTEGGPWTKGPEGVIGSSEADEKYHRVVGVLTGLNSSTVYYVRFVAENEAGSASAPVVSLETAGPPRAVVFGTHTFVAGSATMRVLGSIAPDITPVNEVQTVTLQGAPTSGSFTLSFEGETTSPIPFDATETEVRGALTAMAKFGSSAEPYVTGSRGGPYRVEFEGALRGVDEPQLSGDGSGLSPSGSVEVSTVQNGSSPSTHYHMEYIEKGQLEKSGWGAGAKTPEVDAGSGTEVPEGFTRLGYQPVFATADLQDLTPGDTYEYRLVGENPAGSATSAERSLNVPSVSASSSVGSCPNEVFRTGPSASLPDCRAYEQVTPVSKEGTMEIQSYAGLEQTGQQLVGEDGNRFLLATQAVKWGSNVGAYYFGYLFSREEGKGWQMTPMAKQPQAADTAFQMPLHSSDLSTTALETGWTTGTSTSPEVTLQTGPVGGPYATVASVPRSQIPSSAAQTIAWVAGSKDLSKMVFQAEDRKLLGNPTGTVSGTDLYEYSKAGLHQVNVDSSGKTIGTCGAKMVRGQEEGGSSDFVALTSYNAISADGSRVFFEAVPGSNCSEGKHLYVRIDGSRTVDLGAYGFLAASSSGTRLLVDKDSGGSSHSETLLYDTETGSVKRLLAIDASENGFFTVSRDFSTFYFESGARLTPDAPPDDTLYEGQPQGINLYRYDVASETVRFIDQKRGQSGGFGDRYMSPDGRFLYFESYGVAGVPGAKAGTPSKRSDELYRYDSTAEILECITCASPFEPEPSFSTALIDEEGKATRDNTPTPMVASANGDYVFFDSPSALVPEDVNGQIDPEQFYREIGVGAASLLVYSPSSDVYEWRADGVDGCARAQGCLSLISSGVGGYKVVLLGTDASGRDVFFTSNAPLGPKDNDSAIDVYDARIGGGEPPSPAKPVECEGDACLTPAGAPIDTTPASLSFSGPANPVLSPPVTTRSANGTCRKGLVRRKGKCVTVKKRKCAKKGCTKQKKKRRAVKGTRSTVKHARGGHRQ